MFIFTLCMQITRQATKILTEKLFKRKAILVIGPRQVGKTTLIKDLLEGLNEKFLLLNGDDPKVVELLANAGIEQIRSLIGQNRLIFIDEAQRIPNSAITAKLIVDEFSQSQLILSGSSAFEINQLMQEPLTGRKWTINLWPISWKEYEDEVGYLKAEQSLDQFLIYGGYPEVLRYQNEAQERLQELADSYLFKDVLQYNNLKKPGLLNKLVRALSYQLGNEVSYTELAQTVGADPKTVNHYIDILEQAYVVFRLPPFSGNLRNEIKSNNKIYFYDNGIRNAVIGAFEPITLRQDIGSLWENFLISERLKQNSYAKRKIQSFFWRTKQQQEVDYVEAFGKNVFGYEFKWNPNKSIRFPKTFTENYQTENLGITRKNFRDFVMP